jgi:proline racemase
MRDIEMSVDVVDYHTAGEPFRIVSGGVGPIPGDTILEKRRYAQEHLDRIRRLIVFEPRGHADMYGCFVTEPEDDGADLGVLFFHNAGFSTACGHGTIGLVTWALDSGVLEAKEPETEVIVDVPSGRLRTVATMRDGEVRSVRFRNVPSFVFARGLEVRVDEREIAVDVSYGGAFYASVRASDVGLSVEPQHLTELIRVGRLIKREIETALEVVHPTEPDLRDIYGVIFYDGLEGGPELRQRNVAIFADGEVDRSPCGSGTSARLALLDDSGELERGRELLHSSIIGTEFKARVVGDDSAGDIPAVITEVEGRAHLVGWHTFVLQRGDDLDTGFILR